VTDPEIKKELFKAYKEELTGYNFWMEQMRIPELRHPAFPTSGDLDEQSRFFCPYPDCEALTGQDVDGNLTTLGTWQELNMQI